VVPVEAGGEVARPAASPSETLASSVSPESVPRADAAREVQKVDARNRSVVGDILRDPVSRHMKSAGPLLRVKQTVGEALASVRMSSDGGRIVYFYVADEEGRLQGVVAARKLLLSPLDAKVAAIMATDVFAIPVTASVLEACEFFVRHKLLAYPVVDAERRIVGLVDVDLYTDEIKEIDRRQDSEDLFQLIGMHLSEAEQSNARKSFLGRFPWLLCNVGGGLISAWIADAFQDVSTLAVVAPFIALVTALAESVSIQSVSLAIQALHSQPLNWRVFAAKVRRELVAGFLLGSACGLTVALVAWLWKGDAVVAGSLFLGILGGVVGSAVIGLCMPFTLRLFRCDPQLASGPIALALSDVVTLLCYFNLGRWLLT
jgi:magnesium transporter